MFPEHNFTNMQAIEMTGVLLGSLAQWERARISSRGRSVLPRAASM